MGKPSAPTPPDYAGAATAQGQSNIQGSIANKILGQVNQSTPFGDLTFDQTGSTTVGATPGTPGHPAGGSGFFKNVMVGGTPGNPGTEIPQFTSHITLKPEVQAILDQYTKNQAGMGSVAGKLLGQAGDTLSTPFDPSKLPADSTQQSVQDAMYKRQSQYLDPQFELAQKALDAKLANSGFQIGNEGYDKAQSQFGDTRQKAYADARDSAIGQGATLGLAQRQQAVAEALAARNQPINELSALQTGSQVSQPQFSPSSAQPIAGAPIFDATQAQGNAALQQFGINSGMYNSQMGGLFGLGGAGLLASQLGPAAALSDRRLKKNIRRIGTHQDLGIGIYSFDYLNDVPAVGFMADEVEKIRPDAVITLESGYKAIDYAVLGRPSPTMIA